MGAIIEVNSLQGTLTHPMALIANLKPALAIRLSEWCQRFFRGCRNCLPWLLRIVDSQTGKPLFCPNPKNGFVYRRTRELYDLLKDFDLSRDVVSAKPLYVHPGAADIPEFEPNEAKQQRYVHLGLLRSNMNLEFKWHNEIAKKDIQFALNSCYSLVYRVVNSLAANVDQKMNLEQGLSQTVTKLRSISQGFEFIPAANWLLDGCKSYVALPCKHRMMLRMLLSASMQKNGESGWDLLFYRQYRTILDSLKMNNQFAFLKRVFKNDNYRVKTKPVTEKQESQAALTIKNYRTRFFTLNELQESKYPNITLLNSNNANPNSLMLEQQLENIQRGSLAKLLVLAKEATQVFVNATEHNLVQVTVPEDPSVLQHCRFSLFFAFNTILQKQRIGLFGLKADQWHPVNAILVEPTRGAVFSVAGCKFCMTPENNLQSGFFGAYLLPRHHALEAIVDSNRTFANLVQPKQNEPIISGFGFDWSGENYTHIEKKLFKVILIHPKLGQVSYLIDKRDG